MDEIRLKKNTLVELLENAVQNAEGVNEAVSKAEHFTAMSLYNILPLNQFRNFKLDTDHNQLLST